MTGSHPSRVRGLKSFRAYWRIYNDWVAPFTGAWIEICLYLITSVWLCQSHPSRVRGLK